MDNVYELPWAPGVKYGDIFQQPEREHSIYSFEESNGEMLYSLFTQYEQEALRLIELGLIHPAYDYVLKCSHTFNLLDARGYISVSDRAGYLARVRKMAREIAQQFIAEREKLGFPLLNEESLTEGASK